MLSPSCVGKPWGNRETFTTLPDGRDCLCPRCNSLRSVYLMSFGTDTQNDTVCDGKYFIVEPGSSPHITAGYRLYPDRPTAIKAAYSLAAQYPKRQFCVCKVVGVAKTSEPPIAYRDCDKKVKR